MDRLVRRAERGAAPPPHDLTGARAAVEHALGRLEVCTDDVMRIARVSAVGARVEADIARRARDLRERADERERLRARGST